MCGWFPRAAQYNALNNGLTISLSIFHPLPCINWTFSLSLECPTSTPPPVFASPLLFILCDTHRHGHPHEADFDFCLESASEALLCAPITPSL